MASEHDLPWRLRDVTPAPPPIRIARREETWDHRNAPVHAVAAAALALAMRRLLLAVDGVPGEGLHVWALAGVTGCGDAAVYEDAMRLQRLELVRLRVAEEDQDWDVVPTPSDHRAAVLIRSWRA